MPTAVALIVTDLQRSRLGLASRVDQTIGDLCALEHTVQRVARVKSVDAIVLVHPQDQDPMELLDTRSVGKPVSTYADPGGLTDRHRPMRCAARKWSLTAWRGGLAGATCYDELLPAPPLAEAMDRHKAESALLVGADWVMVDPDYCEQVLARHLAHPEQMAFTFTQAPPGLAGAAVGRRLLGELGEKNGLFGQILSYSPTAPQADPIGRDVCVQIEAEVRSCNQRLIYDTGRSAALIDAIASRLGKKFCHVPATAMAETIRQIFADSTSSTGSGHGSCAESDLGFARLPRQITLELTPKRIACGPILPQHHVEIDREPMPLDLALRIVEQIGADSDTVLTLGGLGDALLYDDWQCVVRAAHEAGVMGITIQTDLLVDQSTLPQLIDAPIDVISVRLNADTARTYQSVMGVDRFGQVADHLQWLLRHRHRDGTNESGHVAASDRIGLPWIVPHLVKTHQTLADMEPFFDRWVHFTAGAVIEPATTGCGLMPRLSPMDMAPPKRFACRQIDRRMSIHCDGRIAQCDQDWLGRAPSGDTTTKPLHEIWQSMNSLRNTHREGRWEELELCRGCVEWHRP